MTMRWLWWWLAAVAAAMVAQPVAAEAVAMTESLASVASERRATGWETNGGGCAHCLAVAFRSRSEW